MYSHLWMGEGWRWRQPPRLYHQGKNSRLSPGYLSLSCLFTGLEKLLWAPQGPSSLPRVRPQESGVGICSRTALHKGQGGNASQ